MIQSLGQLPTKTVKTTTVTTIKWDELFVWQELVRDLIRVAGVIVFAFLLYRAIKLLTKRLTLREIDEPDPLLKRLQVQRAQTLASLLNSVALAIIIVVAGLTVLSTFINIAPLLASVSIAGLAISFGAQSLVKDMINGTFMLFEGQFGIGDVVRIGDTSGLV